MGILEWTTIETPGFSPSATKEILNPDNQGSGTNKIVIAPDGRTIWTIVRRGDRNGIASGGAQVMIYVSSDIGRTWSEDAYTNLARAQSSAPNGTFVWDIAIAPDDPNVIAVACADIVKSPLAQEVWVSIDRGHTWDNTNWPPIGLVQGTDLISTMDISVDTNGHKIVIGTRDGQGNHTNHLQIRTISNGSDWNIQDLSGTPPSTNPITGDILAVKFSPNFAFDSAIVVLYTNGEGTYLGIGTLSVANNTHWQAFEQHVEIRDPNGKVGDSPRVNEIITAQLQLPFDFNGQNAESRCYYICTDAINRSPNLLPNRGVYRIDDTAVSKLMDTTDTFGLIESRNLVKRISSIAYFGTCKSGKLLAGEVLGHSAAATVPTWLMVSLSEYEGVWFPSLKSPTGAANPASDTNLFTLGYGNAQVAWSIDGKIAFAATGAGSLGPWAALTFENGAVNVATGWPAGYVNVVPFDESALSLSRNNGETWNQLSMINTGVTYFNDVAPTADGRTIYLASANCRESLGGFDSVWRSSTNPDVVAPLMVLPLGSCWERILTHVTAPSYEEPQSKLPLLRGVPYCADQTGEIICWAAQGTRAQAWSPDFGDYWAVIIPRDIIQDFCLESPTKLYNLSPTGLVQKMPYTDTGWSMALPSFDSGISHAHTIAVYPGGNVLVGAAADYHKANHAVSFCTNMNTDNPQFQVMTAAGQTQFMGNVHVAFHPRFNENNTIFISDEAYSSGQYTVGGSVYRNNLYSPIKWKDADMLKATGAALGSSTNQKSQTGLVLGMTGEALYSCFADWSEKITERNSGVLRTIDDSTGNYGPLSGMPHPGISWDNLDNFTPAERMNAVHFGTQPTSLKICGCCTMDTDTTLYAIDSQEYAPANKSGMLWSYTDCMAKKGPIQILSEDTVVGCNIMTGRNREIIFTWEQLCIASHYQIQIARDRGFSALIADTGVLTPPLLTAPTFVYPGGGGSILSGAIQVPSLESGQIYYWRCKAHSAANGAKLQSPWSEVRSLKIEDISTAIKSSLFPGTTAIRLERFKLPPNKKYHFFIAHASEDKDWVGPFAYYLHSAGFEVWYDDFVIKIGDSIREKVDEGLKESQYGIVVLSHNFFKKGKTWTRKELDGLSAIEDQEGRKLILPIWHNVDKSDITEYSPMLAGIRAAKSSMDYKSIVDEIIRQISP